jgi:hypothetical protein
VPFFWTVQFGKSVRYAGHATSFDEVIIQGNPDELKFAAYYVRQGKVLAVAALGTWPSLSLIHIPQQRADYLTPCCVSLQVWTRWSLLRPTCWPTTRCRRPPS